MFRTERAAPTALLFDRTFEAVLFPYRHSSTARFTTAVLVLALGLAFMMVVGWAAGALVLTIPLLAILIASWLGGPWLGMGGTLVVTSVALVVGEFTGETLIRVATLIPAALASILLLESVRHAAERTRILVEEKVEALSLAALSQQRLTHALQGSHVIAFTQDLKLRYTWVENPHPAFDPASVIGRTDQELLPPDEAAALRTMKQAVMRTGEPARSRVTLTNGDEKRTYELSVKLLLAQEGEVSGVSCVATDVTDLIRVEQDLERANRAKDEFLSLVSHELKAPLTLIGGNASLLPRLRTIDPSDEFEGCIAEIVNASGNLARIIDDLLLLARLSQGMEVEKEPVLLARLVDQVVRERRDELADRDVKIAMVGDPLPVLAHPVYMAQVIGNLLSNAAKYSPPDQAIEIKVVRTKKEVSLKVRDHGSGIPESEQRRIFENFYRSENSPAAAGLGIGLRVCLLLTEAQGGTISVRNHEDGGAEFVVSLPGGGTWAPTTDEKASL